ncbi:MAG: hypothetical protein U5Q16_17400 [Gammaproteobacteria bacterium]|nr:hypothetical protein [Gammaproteobacteria bacterium]
MVNRCLRLRSLCARLLCARAPVSAALLAGAAALMATPLQAAEDTQAEIERLKQELAAVTERLARLEEQLARSPQVDAQTPQPEAAPAEEPLSVEVLSAAAPGAEREEAVAVEDEPDIHIGGAVRFNAFFRDFERSSESKRGESGFDLFRLGIDGEYRNLLISAEYRWYPFMDTLHHGWVGYEFDGGDQVQVGVHKVPFGILPFASHNYWFGVPYYLGLADDYDLGVKYTRDDGPWNTQAAFYKSEELGDPTSVNRYGFDLVRQGEQQNEEINRFNLRLARTFGAGSGCEHEVGLSGQRGQLYNADTDDSGTTWAAAAHLDSRCGRWNVQLQAARYDYAPKNTAGVDDSIVRMGAFAAGYDVVSDADVLVANLAYNFNVPWRAIDQITCYNDYSRLFKDTAGFEDSQLNTTGCAIGVGSLFTYLDVIQASNMPFFEDGSLAGGGDDEWHTRVNLNIGYYW